ncbi:MAG TPA: hypothetical protein VGO92_05705 [Acidimicrobiales bacterium]|nr:hypothetical protein [Acidimicrobiales bacterium]
MRDGFGLSDDGALGGFPGGATFTSGDGSMGFVLAEDEAERALGGALAWSRSAGVRELHVLAPADAAGALARRALAFADPPAVHRVVGREVARAEPSTLPVFASTPPPGDEAFVEQFRAAGADPVVEQGMLVAEVLGLEVARVVDGQLEVGVGKHDREAQKLMNPDRRPFDALVAAVEAVRAVRRAGGPPHPMKDLAASRWLRAVVCADPSLARVSPGAAGGAGAAGGLWPVPSTVPRADLRLPAPAPAAGDGVVVVCSTGIDVDLVPAAADERLAHGDGADTRLVLVVPEPDAYPVTRALAAALARPAEVVTVPADWRTLSP